MQVRSQKRFSTSEVLSLVAKAERVLGKVELLPQENLNSGEFTAKTSLSRFFLPSGIKVQNVDVLTATFKPKGNPTEHFNRTVIDGHRAFKDAGSFRVMYVFKPLQLNESTRPDECGITIWKQKLSIAYECGTESNSLRASYFKGIIRHNGLPIRVSEDERGFSLSHEQKGLDLTQLSTDIWQHNPMGFRCEMAEANLEKATAIVAGIATGSSVSGVSWTFVGDDEKPLGLQEIVGAALPSDEFRIVFGYKLDDLAVIDELKKVKITTGYFSTDVAKFELHGKEGELEIRTNPKGHMLYAEVPEKLLPELKRKLGVKIVSDE